MKLFKFRGKIKAKKNIFAVIFTILRLRRTGVYNLCFTRIQKLMLCILQFNTDDKVCICVLGVCRSFQFVLCSSNALNSAPVTGHCRKGRRREVRPSGSSRLSLLLRRGWSELLRKWPSRFLAEACLGVDYRRGVTLFGRTRSISTKMSARLRVQTEFIYFRKRLCHIKCPFAGFLAFPPAEVFLRGT